ncbi:MAG: ParB/RepB/Spo0J family partition protein [Roseitalea sp.]|nr:ParB/RepB/Spo0J family partition protein [Roseitalea sp.]
MDIQEIRLDEIAVVDRVREVDVDHARFIANSIVENGQIQPALVRPTPNAENGAKPYTLVVGGHRHLACQIAQLETLRAEVRKLSPEQAKVLEIDENLARHDLTVLDRAISLAERKKAYEKLHPQTKHGGDRKSAMYTDQDGKLDVLKFSEDAADKLGISERSVERAVMIADKLDKAARDALRGTPSANNQSHLLTLCKLPAKDQRRVAKAVAKDGDWAGAVATIKGANGGAKADDDGGLDAALKAYRKMTDKARAAFHEAIADREAP